MVIDVGDIDQSSIYLCMTSPEGYVEALGTSKHVKTRQMCHVQQKQESSNISVSSLLDVEERFRNHAEVHDITTLETTHIMSTQYVHNKSTPTHRNTHLGFLGHLKHACTVLLAVSKRPNVISA